MSVLIAGYQCQLTFLKIFVLECVFYLLFVCLFLCFIYCLCVCLCVSSFVCVCLCVLSFVCVGADEPYPNAQVLVLMVHETLAEDLFTPSKCVSTIVR